MSATYPERLAQALGLTLDESEAAAVLDLARVVAHGSERRYAPLSTYLAGQFVATRAQTGAALDEALREAADLAQRVLDNGA
ncbi:MAG: DUF6457 domain-containing protein [Actinomycetota bacterium]|nr:DUF6457 domain-containing protein [Actinomycetota bacterium]